MIATEQHAKMNWWCPEVRFKVGNVAGSNRTFLSPWTEFKRMLLKTFFPRIYWWKYGKHGKCLASGCGMWRWHNRSRTLGYCGLAGKPE